MTIVSEELHDQYVRFKMPTANSKGILLEFRHVVKTLLPVYQWGIKMWGEGIILIQHVMFLE